MLETTMHRRLPITLLGLFAFVQITSAADWPQFRGPLGDGVSKESKVATKWGKNDNVLWKTPLPQPGNGSAIVVGDRV